MLRHFIFVVLVVATAAQKQCSPELCTGSGSPKCPLATGIFSSKPLGVSLPETQQRIYFRNAAPFPANILRVDDHGQEVSQGLLPQGMRRALMTQHGDVWVARAVRPGTVADGRLLLEHRIGAVPIEDCDCPQPQFIDCSKGPTFRAASVISDPVVFENRAAEPVDLFYFNGTCEELVSWDEIGGVQPFRRKSMLSTQGHSFRLRSAATRRFLMAHTLNDLVIRACAEDEAQLRGSSVDGLESLRAQTRFFESEAARLREQLATELAELALAIGYGSNSTSLKEAARLDVGVAPGGAATWSLASGLLGVAK